MRRLVASGLLPERAGQPVKAWVHISLADLLGSTATPRCRSSGPRTARARWAARRAFAVRDRQRQTAALGSGGKDAVARMLREAARLLGCRGDGGAVSTRTATPSSGAITR